MIETLYKEKRKLYINMMSRILGGDHAGGEDVTQEAFARAWKFKESYDPKRGKIGPWFNRILFNALHDYQMEMKGQPVSSDKEISVEDVFSQDVLLRTPELSSYIRKRVYAQTNPKHKRVLELFFIYGYTSTEISQIEEKVSVSNVTTIVARFREQLTGELKWK